VTDGVLMQAVIYLAAAVIGVPLAKRAGLGAVLGYLLAGVVIGPFVLRLVGGEGAHVMHFAEFGVVMMLFLVGLELRPTLLWQMRRRIFGLGGLQVAVTAAAGAGAALAVGVPAPAALAIGLILAMSSTAIVLATLAEKKLLTGAGGQASFSILLFQDIAVIPILAVFPLLATAAPAGASTDAGRPGWLQGLMVLGAVLLVVGVGRYAVRPVFRVLARTGLRETFTAFALLLVVGIALLMTLVDLSPALGTFLAGVMLADSEYRHELEGDIEPFKGLLLGLFFISVGAQIDFALIAAQPLLIAGITLGTMAIKLAVLHGLGRAFGFDRPARWLVALGLCQIGEFAFVLLAVASGGGILTADQAAPLMAAVALSMMLTPLAFVILERVVLPRVTAAADARPHDEIVHEGAPVVIAGYGRFGQVVGRQLRASRIEMTILDLDPEIVDFVHRIGVKVYYGDASRLELLHAAGCAKAKVLVVAIDDHEQAMAIVHAAREHFPHLRIAARAKDRIAAMALDHAGAHYVIRETFVSAWETGIAVMRELGMRAFAAERRGQRWRKHEEQELRDLAAMRKAGSDEEAYWDRTKRGLDEAERLMRDEDPHVFTVRDGAWHGEARDADPSLAGEADRAPSAPTAN
jgi:monovalent cation:proton antiporter-2 (CPA2) family protein